MKNISVDEYIIGSGKWSIMLNMLREILLALEMEETLKWGTPVYCIGGKNVVGIGYFKLHTALWFYHGIFLSDKNSKLINANKDEDSSIRQWRFHSEDEIEDDLDFIIEYVKEAISNSKAGKMNKPIRNKPYTIPPELKEALDNDKNLSIKFSTLSHNKKRDYASYIGQAKRYGTRLKRIEKIIPLILSGKGPYDQTRQN